MDWVSPADYKWWPEHTRWAIENLTLLQEGLWPPDPRDTGYTDIPIRRNNNQAYFVTPVVLSAEIKVRLKRCGPDGTLAYQCLAEGWDELTLSELMKTPVYIIERRVNRVVKYCSGAKRRLITYDEFKQHRRLKNVLRR